MESVRLIRGVGKNTTGGMDLFGRGLYLTDSMEVAKFYGDTIKQYEITGSIYDTTKPFSESELRSFCKHFDSMFSTNEGAKMLRQIESSEMLDSTDYIEISWVFNSNSDVRNILKKNGLSINQEYSYADDCTMMNMVLEQMGYVGLKYSTDEIEALENIGLGRLNAFVVFKQSAIHEL